MAPVPSDTHVVVQETSKPKKYPLYFLLLVSPVAWFKCFALIFRRTRARTQSIALLQHAILLFVILLVIAFSYVYYSVSNDAGQYNLYLSNVASNQTLIAQGRSQFDNLIWRTVLKTFFLGVMFGLIQACHVFLAVQWRQRLCDRFRELLFQSPNGCILYDTTQRDIDMSKVVAHDVKQFTNNFTTVLFGSMFFMGIISAFALIIIICVSLVSATNGDAYGILICFVAFIFCVLITLPATQLYNQNLMKQSKLKGRLLEYLQRIQTNAECIVLYASQRVELKYVERLITKIRNSMLIGAIGLALIDFPIQLMFALTGICTYVMPAVVFFYIRSVQSPDLAQSYLSVIPFYSFLMTIFGQLLCLMESTLATLTMGDHLWTMLNLLEKLTQEHQKRIAHEQESGIRQEDPNILAIYHLNISLPNVVNAPLLQRNVNLEVNRNQCVLISGPSGCGKTSLFRILAGLQPIDGERLVLPERRHLLFIPQRPYLPLGSLRSQALFLLEKEENVSDQDLFQLFQSVNLQSLLERHALNAVTDWSTVLSIGEQQRLAFVRLLAFFTLSSKKEQVLRDTLVFFDESTSAIDTSTEHKIYSHLNHLHAWFVTISHRPALAQFHTKSLQFFMNGSQHQLKEEEEEQIEGQISVGSILESDNEKNLSNSENNENELVDMEQLSSFSERSSIDNMLLMDEKNTSKWKLIINIFKFIHLPFQPDDKKLKLQTIIGWLFTLLMLGLNAFCLYLLTDRTANLYSYLSNYASGSVSFLEARQSITSDIASYIIIMVATPTLYSLVIGGGQVLATLYTRRQLIYLARLLLDGPIEEYDNNLLYHSRHLTVIPNLVSHEVAELNKQVFYSIFGHIYYLGIASHIILDIILSVLLGKQNGGSTGILVLYVFLLGFLVVVSALSVLVKNWSICNAFKFTQFVTAHKRVDFQAEQIALSGENVSMSEENELRQKLDSSIRAELHAGFFYSIIVGVVWISVVSIFLVNYGIPAAIFFHKWYSQGTVDPTIANTFITLSVYMSNLFAYMYYINYLGDPLARIQSIGIRVVGYLGRLNEVDRI